VRSAPQFDFRHRQASSAEPARPVAPAAFGMRSAECADPPPFPPPSDFGEAGHFGETSQAIPFAGAPLPPFVRLIYLFAGCNLSRLQKSFDEFTFAANGQAGKFLEPFALRHFGFGAKPVGQKFELVGGYFLFTGAVEQVVQQPGRKTLSANARHGYSP